MERSDFIEELYRRIDCKDQTEYYEVALIAEIIILEDAKAAGAIIPKYSPVEFLEAIGYDHFIENYEDLYKDTFTKMIDKYIKEG